MAKKISKSGKLSESPDKVVYFLVVPEHWIQRTLEREKQALQWKSDFRVISNKNPNNSPVILIYKEIYLLLYSNPSIKQSLTINRLVFRVSLRLYTFKSYSSNEIKTWKTHNAVLPDSIVSSRDKVNLWL